MFLFCKHTSLEISSRHMQGVLHICYILCINPLNAELNSIYHLLVLSGDLTFMGPCIVSIFQHTSNNMQRYSLFISGNCSTCFGWNYHPKYVEQFPDINKQCNVASCWIYIGLLLGAHPFLHISRIRVNCELEFVSRPIPSKQE
jgi:hypothetical protein